MINQCYTKSNGNWSLLSIKYSSVKHHLFSWNEMKRKWQEIQTFAGAKQDIACDSEWQDGFVVTFSRMGADQRWGRAFTRSSARKHWDNATLLHRRRWGLSSSESREDISVRRAEHLPGDRRWSRRGLVPSGTSSCSDWAVNTRGVGHTRGYDQPRHNVQVSDYESSQYL